MMKPMITPWVPFDASDDEVADLHVLRAGVPGDLLDVILAWLMRLLISNGAYNAVRRDRVSFMQVDLRYDLGLRQGRDYWDHMLSAALRGLDPSELIRVVDYCVHHWASETDVDLLSVFLERGSSRYTVVAASEPARWRLQNRVPEGVQQSTDHTIATAGNAGKDLAKAWAYLYGLDPKPTEAMAWAVKAVETAAIPVVEPNNTIATLGTVMGSMRTDPDWGLPLRLNNKLTSHHGMILEMMSTVWVGHHDRHGNTDPVTFEQAQTSVHLAATLVAWFSAHLVSKQ